ncbi:MAG: transposase [Acidimicrobiia bacterium]|nr:transposase [Acidimicrobiia bacterium]
MRRTRLTGEQAALFPDWRYHAFVTNQTGPVTVVDQEHRHHAVVELAIRDLKEGTGVSHMPSGHFSANGAWLAAAVLAHNLARWTQIIGDPNTSTPINTTATFRSRIVSIPGRLVNRAGQITLRLPTRWPWAHRYVRILTNLRALPQLC